MLDKKSYQQTKIFLKENKISQLKLTGNNIEIIHDGRLDYIKSYKRLTNKQLSSLAVKANSKIHVYYIKDFKTYVDISTLNNSIGLKDYWFQQLSNGAFNTLTAKYSFLKTNKTFNVILFQEEWMTLIKKITKLSFIETNVLRKTVSKRNHLRQFTQLIDKSLISKYNVPPGDRKKIINILINCIYFLPCKSHLISEAYINLISNNGKSVKTIPYNGLLLQVKKNIG